jgi:periplasmic copper chaperone A
MKGLVPALAATLVLFGCDGQPARSTTMGPFVRLPAVPGRPAVGYFELDIDGDRGALTGVASPQARRVEMHETMAAGTMSAMRPLRRIPVRGERLTFAPGGRHLMLYELAPAVRAGGRILLVLHFERGEPRTLAARVEAAGGPS